ncbi:MAG: L,D-transpeptidase [Beijerinckiaceae bacterium]|jgi:hypothetical protein|nr:L,D-transpeptidase [Beijerinckiaceae bacterium]
MRFRFFSTAVLAASVVAGLAVSTSVSQARVNVTVDLTTQRMHVTSASGSYTWKVSTGRGQYNTPRGTYRPTVMRRMHYSRKYNNSPMPYSVFFRGGYAIHGTNAVSRLGAPASHGCIRLATGNAAALYAMIKREGARITIVGSRDQYYANQRRSSKTKFVQVRQSKKKYVSAKRYKDKKYYAKRYNKKQFAKTHRSKSKYAANKRYQQKGVFASSSRSSAPLGYAPVRKKRSTFDFFRNPNNI